MIQYLSRPNLATPSQPRPPVAKDSNESSSKKKIDLSEDDKYDSDPSYKTQVFYLNNCSM